jgi:hypothetical protein
LRGRQLADERPSRLKQEPDHQVSFLLKNER